jgi:hypothetical protein
MSDSMELIRELWPVLIALAVIQVSLTVAAMIHIFRHPTYRAGNRVMWIIITLALNTIGPVLYFAIGRGEEAEVSDEGTSPAQSLPTLFEPDAETPPRKPEGHRAEILRIEGLEKSFKDNSVLRGISLRVEEGSVFGFIGANGAGKTVTMKMILGLIAPDRGEIHVCGEKVVFGSSKTNRNVGYLPDVPEYYGYMRPRQYLRLCGDVTGMDPETIEARLFREHEIPWDEIAFRTVRQTLEHFFADRRADHFGVHAGDVA